MTNLLPASPGRRTVLKDPLCRVYDPPFGKSVGYIVGIPNLHLAFALAPGGDAPAFPYSGLIEAGVFIRIGCPVDEWLARCQIDRRPGFGAFEVPVGSCIEAWGT